MAKVRSVRASSYISLTKSQVKNILLFIWSPRLFIEMYRGYIYFHLYLHNRDKE